MTWKKSCLMKNEQCHKFWSSYWTTFLSELHSNYQLAHYKFESANSTNWHTKNAKKNIFKSNSLI